MAKTTARASARGMAALSPGFAIGGWLAGGKEAGSEDSVVGGPTDDPATSAEAIPLSPPTVAGANGPPAPTVRNFNCVTPLVAKVRVEVWSAELTRPLRSKSLTLVIVAGLVTPCGSLRALVSSVVFTRNPLKSPAPESA